MTVAEYIADELTSYGVTHVFMVSGGGAMYLDDAICKSGKYKVVYCHHEQACAMAAVGFSKITGKPSVVLISTGCASTNAITGLLDAWQDGVPVVFISGQVNLKDADQVGIGKKRNHGVQGGNVIDVVRPLTKYTTTIRHPYITETTLPYCFRYAMNAPYGPVWIEIPMDVQNSKFLSFSETINEIGIALISSQRPIFVVGNGARNSDINELAEKLQIPCVFTYLTVDMMPSDHPLNIGRLGTKGDQAGNYAVRQADVIIVLGSSLTIPVIGYGDDFGKGAKVFNINIDNGHFVKNFVHIWIRHKEYTASKLWQLQCLVWKDNWHVYRPEYANTDYGINIYHLIKHLSDSAPDDAVIVSDAGSSYYATAQSFQFKGTQRYVTSGGQADMGFGLPAAIGASLASNKPVIAIIGDGGFQTNIQELATLKALDLNVKLVIINNGGYLSIRNTSDKFFEGRHFGTDEQTGLFFPDLEKIAAAYEIPYFRVVKEIDLNSMDVILEMNMPVIFEVMCVFKQEILPAAAQGKSLSEMRHYINKEI